jgi:hypothetical protein
VPSAPLIGSVGGRGGALIEDGLCDDLALSFGNNAMRTILAVLVATAMLAMSVAAQEDTGSGNVMLPLCRSWLRIHSGDAEAVTSEIGHDVGEALKRFEKAGICAGFVRGVSEMLRTLNEPPPTPGMPQVCIPTNATNDQLVRVVVSFSERHPEMTNEDFIVVATTAIATAWPCPKEKP